MLVLAEHVDLDRNPDAYPRLGKCDVNCRSHQTVSSNVPSIATAASGAVSLFAAGSKAATKNVLALGAPPRCTPWRSTIAVPRSPPTRFPALLALTVVSVLSTGTSSTSLLPPPRGLTPILGTIFVIGDERNARLTRKGVSFRTSKWSFSCYRSMIIIVWGIIYTQLDPRARNDRILCHRSWRFRRKEACFEDVTARSRAGCRSGRR